MYGRPYQREIINAALEGQDVFVQAGELHRSLFFHNGFHAKRLSLSLRSNIFWVTPYYSMKRSSGRIDLIASKSLCFQLPAVIDHGITIVVSPLLALMNNQVAALRAINIEVATVNSNTLQSDRHDIFKDLCCGRLMIPFGFLVLMSSRTSSYQTNLCNPRTCPYRVLSKGLSNNLQARRTFQDCHRRSSLHLRMGS